MRPNRCGRDQLLGRWVLAHGEDSNESSQRISLDFAEDGTLTYEIDTRDRVRILKLVYRVESDQLVTDQPSSPREHHTKYVFEERDLLVLDNDGTRTWYK